MDKLLYIVRREANVTKQNMVACRPGGTYHSSMCTQVEIIVSRMTNFIVNSSSRWNIIGRSRLEEFCVVVLLSNNYQKFWVPLFIRKFIRLDDLIKFNVQNLIEL